MRSVPALMGLAAATLAAPLLLLGSAEASTPATAVHYGDSGWTYLQTTAGGGPDDFASPSFDDSAWAAGEGAFGSPSRTCAVRFDVATNWDVDTDLLARKRFSLPPGATDLRIGIAIDNGYIAYLNGVQVGSGDHSGCATYDSVVIPVADSLLRDGVNTLAVRAQDRGQAAFFDARVSFTAGPAYRICGPKAHGKAHKQHKPRKAGSTIPVKLRICDASGARISARHLVVHATTLQTSDGGDSAVVRGSGKANNSPLNDFRCRSGRAGCIFNLSTKGMTAGTWVLAFTINGEADPTYVYQFRLRR